LLAPVLQDKEEIPQPLPHNGPFFVRKVAILKRFKPLARTTPQGLALTRSWNVMRLSTGTHQSLLSVSSKRSTSTISDQIHDWPEHALEFNRLPGCICFHQERFAETIELETKALERFEDDVEALIARASARYFTGDLVGVEQDIQAAMRLDDAGRDDYSIMVKLVRLGKAREAITYWHDIRLVKPATKFNAVGVANLRSAIPRLSSRAERLALE
jgi:hypothetical protein